MQDIEYLKSMYPSGDKILQDMYQKHATGWIIRTALCMMSIRTI